MEWKGVMPAVTTKFTVHDELDLNMFSINLKAQLDAGVEAIILGGSLGEASTLSNNEKQVLSQVDLDNDLLYFKSEVFELLFGSKEVRYYEEDLGGTLKLSPL